VDDDLRILPFAKMHLPEGASQVLKPLLKTADGGYVTAGRPVARPWNGAGVETGFSIPSSTAGLAVHLLARRHQDKLEVRQVRETTGTRKVGDRSRAGYDGLPGTKREV
jgi:hypothetical protein